MIRIDLVRSIRHGFCMFLCRRSDAGEDMASFGGRFREKKEAGDMVSEHIAIWCPKRSGVLRRRRVGGGGI